MQFAIQIANILFLPTFLLDKSKITAIIDIFWELIKHLGFDNRILHNRKIMFKSDYITIWNIVWSIYCKQEKFSYIYKFY